MKTNKSIDGLSTRVAEKKSPKTPKAPKPKVAKVESPEIQEPVVTPDPLSDSLEINVIPDDEQTTKKPSVEESKPLQSVEDFLNPVEALNLEDDPKTAKKKAKKEKKAEKKNKEKKPVKKARRIITIVLLVLVLLLIIGVSALLLWGNDIIAKITGGRGNVFDLATFIDDKYDPLKTDANGRTNILAFGTSGYNMDGDEGNGVHAGAQLTDSIMLISVNQNTGDVAMLSLPRDLKASPTCTATGKINEIYWCNNMQKDNEEGGAQALMNEVGSILNVDIQYFAHLNWGSLVTIVDMLGGIDVVLDEDILDYYWTGAVYYAGTKYHLTGEEALGLSRARHGTDGGDFSRGASQQKILIGIKDKIFEKDLSLTDIVGLASTLGDNFRSNLSVAELKSAAHLTFDFNFDEMRNLNLWPDYMTTGNIDGISYVLPRGGAYNYDNIQAFVATQLSNDPRVYEEPTILVLNASEVAGLAGDEKKKLTEAGYPSVYTDNAPEAPEGTYPYGTTVYAASAKPGTKRLLRELYGNVETTLPSTIQGTHDFIIIVNPEPEETEKSTEE